MVIVDASVAYKWFAKNEENSDLALTILQRHVNGQEKIIVPDLILYELANAWVTKTAISTVKIKANLKDLQDAGLEIESPTFDLMSKAATFARKYRLSVYDAIYAILAKDKRCNLITADKKFVEKINLPFVKLLEEYK